MCPDVTSRQHRSVHAFKLAARREGDLALLDGWHLLHEAAAADIEIAAVAVSQEPPDARDAALLRRLARESEVVTVTMAVMNAISPARTPTGIAALARPRTRTMRETLSPSPALVIVAVDVQDPGNAGAIVRSAEAGGATGVILAGASADPWGWKALRAGMGSTFRLPVVRETDVDAVLAALREAQVALLASVPRDAASMHEVDLRGSVALLLGSEGAGLAPAIVERADQRVAIPMDGAVDSLNVAVAAALLVYEARRQRRQVGG